MTPLLIELIASIINYFAISIETCYYCYFANSANSNSTANSANSILAVFLGKRNSIIANTVLIEL